VVFLPEERILFTGDLVEERCFAIVPYFPPDDTDVDGEKWIAVLDRLEGLAPEIVVPGHGSVGGSSLVREVRNYLAALRDEVRELQSAGVPVDAAVEQLDARMRSLHPDWVQPEWIGFGVRHFYEAG
jgi:Metallo-beta-lactamase superfamily.